MTIESAIRGRRLEEYLLALVDRTADKIKEIVRIASPIIEDAAVIIGSTEEGFSEDAGSMNPQAHTASGNSDGTSTRLAGNGRLVTLFVTGAASCVVAYFTWRRR